MRRSIRLLAAATAILGAALSAAFAGEVEATIVDINPDEAKLTLSDGNSYSIPVDFYIDDLKPGMAVLVFFEEDDNGKTLSDVQIQQ